jgi:hypothetical protein
MQEVRINFGFNFLNIFLSKISKLLILYCMTYLSFNL